MKRLLAILLLTTLSQAIHARNYTEIELVKDNNSSVPDATSNKSKREGWVLLHYAVDEKGKTGNYLVIDSNNSETYLSKTIKHLENLEFKPATLDGKPVASSRFYIMQFEKAFFQSNNNGMSRAFNRRYNKISDALANNRLDDASANLQELRDDYAKNLTEQALSAWLHALYYYAVQDWYAYRDATQVAFYLRDSLPAHISMQNIQNLMQWQMYKKNYSGAAYTLGALNRLEGVSLTEEAFNKSKQDISNAFYKEPLIKIDSQLSANNAWFYRLTGSNISIDVHQGKIHTKSLRCNDAIIDLSDVELNEFKAPNAESECFLFVKGDAGTQFTYTEKEQYENLAPYFE
ncbi:hypothetical protein KIH87_02850 [Paraneptunicella aestuarii]|uniref:energy transducer TonB n=1 Tax=Paraneptunicella aestuarii TaxID=2831148 RepID=UPI001E563139|nr:hypothetical protein [Paraneptunicella aestuarii]UAA39320.1 hypothetical protein KIH87_02850 [Paraneptunicella aestuarii]